ncbi:hypothetical protein BDF20DRAFT_454740 [Mycotypha africana]|uniref:uncharacterized protein n=1 Tax=Mycotypha africana TaxID=64632 RepID=UPI00230152D7|nr:uncharacterized protein BDF20DRAFT_454740 [Mycotypha africana]KAI8982160.1 hypothetical protein BDF20DRAFT_454740 [Mycotypha africana]
MTHRYDTDVKFSLYPDEMISMIPEKRSADLCKEVRLKNFYLDYKYQCKRFGEFVVKIDERAREALVTKRNQRLQQQVVPTPSPPSPPSPPAATSPAPLDDSTNAVSRGQKRPRESDDVGGRESTKRLKTGPPPSPSSVVTSINTVDLTGSFLPSAGREASFTAPSSVIRGQKRSREIDDVGGRAIKRLKVIHIASSRE